MLGCWAVGLCGCVCLCVCVAVGLWGCGAVGQWGCGDGVRCPRGVAPGLPLLIRPPPFVSLCPSVSTGPSSLLDPSRACSPGNHPSCHRTLRIVDFLMLRMITWIPLASVRSARTCACALGGLTVWEDALHCLVLVPPLSLPATRPAQGMEPRFRSGLEQKV